MMWIGLTVTHKVTHHKSIKIDNYKQLLSIQKINAMKTKDIKKFNNCKVKFLNEDNDQDFADKIENCMGRR